MSDTAALHAASIAAMRASGARFTFTCDPTPGGLATTLNKLPAIRCRDDVAGKRTLPVKPEVGSNLQFWGWTLYVANRGKLVAICAAEDAGDAVVA